MIRRVLPILMMDLAEFGTSPVRTVGPYRVAASQTWSAGALVGMGFVAGAVRAAVFVGGGIAKEVDS